MLLNEGVFSLVDEFSLLQMCHLLCHLCHPCLFHLITLHGWPLGTEFAHLLL